MPRERSVSPIRWKESKKTYQYNHKKWEDLVADLYEEPGPLQGGLPIGNINAKKKKGIVRSFMFTIFSKHLDTGIFRKSFGLCNYGEDIIKTQEAAIKFQKQFCLEHQLMKNQYRMISDGIVEMILSQGQSTIFNVENLNQLTEYIWHAFSAKYKGEIVKWYAQSHMATSRTTMANIILGPHAGDRIDHLNGISLDNRHMNLVSATALSNALNHCMDRRNMSGVNGVSRNNMKGKLYWQARWRKNRKTIHGPNHRYYENDEAGEREAFGAACHDREEADIITGNRNGKRPKLVH